MEAPQFMFQVGRMPRQTRKYAPGVGFHVVAVTQGRQRWFKDDIADRIVSDIDEAGAAAGHRILARTVMPNHFHIIIRHGTEPLAWMMQRVMQRAAMAVKKKYSHEGHAFQARYWAEPVPTPQYLRRAIVYTHENPCADAICCDAADYKWSSHADYLGLPTTTSDDVGFREGLMLFAQDSLNIDDVLQNYLKFVGFCRERRRLGILGDWLLPGSKWFGDAPSATFGDTYWSSTFTNFHGDVERPRKRLDVRATAERLLRQIDPAVPFDVLRYAGPKSRLSDVRKQLTCAMLTAGCAPCQISRRLNISPSYVSKLRREMRLPAASS
jgi:REP element-mobilizing transposase RayT